MPRAAPFFIVWALACAALAGDPTPAPGIDPGGVAVAIVSEGLDYTRPEIAARLARDGEGEIVGFDFADGDRYPFNAGGGGTALALAVLAEAPAARLAPVRVAAAAPGAFAEALAFVARSPARIALVTGRDGSADGGWRSLRQGAPRAGGVLFIVPADGAGAEADEAARDSGTIGNLIVVAASAAAGAPLTAARIAALAARIAEAEPALDAAALKRRVLALAASGRSP